jgi:hypothetical protein
MSPTPESDKDDLESLLTPRPDADSAIEQTVFARTARVLARRRLARRLAYVAGLAACYAAGLLTMRLAAPPAVGGAVVVVPAPPVAPAPPRDSALAREERAAEDDRRAELYRQAGDQYLADHGDVRSALRCYGRSLDAGAELTLRPDDHWLLMAIKDARQKENRHAKAVP